LQVQSNSDKEPPNGEFPREYCHVAINPITGVTQESTQTANNQTQYDAHVGNHPFDYDGGCDGSSNTPV
jgi:hypothetical protein